jgi:hypothetical protein
MAKAKMDVDVDVASFIFLAAPPLVSPLHPLRVWCCSLQWQLPAPSYHTSFGLNKHLALHQWHSAVGGARKQQHAIMHRQFVNCRCRV